MNTDSEIPKPVQATDRLTLNLLAGSRGVADELAEEDGFASASVWIRGLVEREMLNRRPSEYSRIRAGLPVGDGA